MFTRMISLEALDKVPQMYALYEESVTTNIGMKEALAWVGVAKRMANTDTPPNADHQPEFGNTIHDPRRRTSASTQYGGYFDRLKRFTDKIIRVDHQNGPGACPGHFFYLAVNG